MLGLLALLLMGGAAFAALAYGCASPARKPTTLDLGESGRVFTLGDAQAQLR